MQTISDKIYFDGQTLTLRGVDFFDVRAIFECGQAFRFDKVAGSSHAAEYGGVAFGRYISVAQDGDEVIIYGADEADFYNIWLGYFALDADMAAIRRDILTHSDAPRLSHAAEVGRGIRILRQNSWEALCSFIISQNNNIPRIKGLIRALCERLGEPIDASSMLDHGARATEYTFPTPEAICEAGVDVLRELKTGFRAKYIYDAARRVCDGSISLDAVFAAPTAEASKMLEEISGVGPKVAACTLLFGFGKLDAFPVDVWIRPVIEKYGFDPAALGDYAGLAQQYLFYAEREEAK
jgi:N-glycosylase/DNA lyase